MVLEGGGGGAKVLEKHIFCEVGGGGGAFWHKQHKIVLATIVRHQVPAQISRKNVPNWIPEIPNLKAFSLRKLCFRHSRFSIHFVLILSLSRNVAQKFSISNTNAPECKGWDSF